MSAPNCFSFILTWPVERQIGGGLFDYPHASVLRARLFPAYHVNKCLCVCVCACMRWIQSFTSAASCVYSFIKPNHPTGWVSRSVPAAERWFSSVLLFFWTSPLKIYFLPKASSINATSDWSNHPSMAELLMCESGETAELVVMMRLTSE